MKYSATFANGITITRTSDRAYTHAWLVTFNVGDNDRPGQSKGFASSEANADKAARAAIPAKSIQSGYVKNVVTHVTAVTVK